MKENLQKPQKVRLIVLSFLLFLLPDVLLAQTQINAQGVVASATTGEPLVGVSVGVKGKSTGTSTNDNGQFTLSVSPGDILVFSYIGFTPREITVQSASPIKVSMEEDARSLDDVVVIGYGTVRKKDLTGSVGQ